MDPGAIALIIAIIVIAIIAIGVVSMAGSGARGHDAGRGVGSADLGSSAVDVGHRSWDDGWGGGDGGGGGGGGD